MVSEEDFNYVVDNLYSMLQTCYDRCIGNCGCDKEYDRSVAIVKDMYSTIERVRKLADDFTAAGPAHWAPYVVAEYIHRALDGEQG